MNQKLLFKYYALTLGDDWQQRSPMRLSGWEVVEALWPLNDEFKEHYIQFKNLPYLAEFEKYADDAQERFVFDGRWGLLGIETWRVILERHQQALVVALSNEAAGNLLMPIPEGLPKNARTGAAILFLLQEMKLPFPVGDRAAYEPDQPLRD